jgi:hypothetical protein
MPTTTLLNPYPVQHPAPSAHYLCTAWWTCFSTPRQTWRNRSDILLATGQALSVIPVTIREMLDLVTTPAPGWRGRVPNWFGARCRIGRARLWLPITEEPGRFREFSLLALLPRDEPEDAPPFVHLGAQFLLEHRARLVLDCSSASRPGRLIIP